MTDSGISDALPLGTIVAGYRLTRVIAQSGLSIIYEAVSAVDAIAKRVAIKELFVQNVCRRADGERVLVRSADPVLWDELRQRFETEARKIVVHYSHPSIVKGENMLDAHASSFLIMEHVDGLSLRDWLTRLSEPATEAQIRAALAPILDAIEYMHEHDDLHRDIAPDNILLRRTHVEDAAPEPVLIDFQSVSECCVLAPSAPTIQLVRSGYSPPEQYEPARLREGPQTDLYAFGAVLYFCIAGHAPVPANERMAAVEARGPDADPYVRAFDLPNRARFSPLFLAAIDQALSLDGARRPQSVDRLRAALGWFPSGRPRSRFFTKEDVYPSFGSPPDFSEDTDIVSRMPATLSPVPPRRELRIAWQCTREGAAEALAEMTQRDADFDLKGFMEAAATTYHAIGEALALNNLPNVKSLLAPDVYDRFTATGAERDAEEGAEPLRVVRPTSVTATDAAVDRNTAIIELLIAGDARRVKRCDDGTLVYLTDETVILVRQRVTFARELDQAGSQWIVLAFEGAWLGML